MNFTSFCSLLVSLCASVVFAQTSDRTFVVVRIAEKSFETASTSADVPLGSVVEVERVEGRQALLAGEKKHWIAANRLARPEKAVQIFTALLDRSPGDVQLLAARGNLLVELSRFEEALVDFDVLIRLRPEAYRAFNQRGFALSRLGRIQPALDDFNRAVKLAPNYGIAYYNRGYVLYQQGEYDASIADFNQALRLLKNDASSLNNRGLSWYAKGDFDRALQDFDRAAEIAPDEPLIYNNRGWVWQRKGKPEKATADFRKANRLVGSGRTLPSQEPRSVGRREKPAPVASGAKPAPAHSAQERFEQIWRDIAVNDPAKGASQSQPGKTVSDGNSNNSVPIDEMLRQGVDLKQDPDLLAAVGVFAPDELQRIEEEVKRRAQAANRNLVGQKSANNLGLGPIDAEAIDQLQRTAIHGIYKFDGERLVILGSTDGNRRFANFLGDRSSTETQLILQRVGRSVANLTGRSDTDHLQGIWQVVSAQSGDRQYDDAKQLQFAFRHDRLEVRGERDASCQFKVVLDPAAVPKSFRLTLSDYRGPAGERNRQIQSGDALKADYSDSEGAAAIGLSAQQPDSQRSPLVAFAVFAAGLVLVGLIARYGGAMVSMSGQGSYISPAARIAAPPGRLHVGLAAVVLTILAGSEMFASFQWKPLALSVAVAEFAQVSFFSTTMAHISSWLRDMMFAAAVSFFWMGVLTIDRRGWLTRLVRLGLLLAVGIAFRVVVEFFDSWLNANSSLYVDISPEAAGMLLGALFWCFAGQTIVDWLRSLSIDRRPPALLDWLLLAYFLAFFVYSIWPLDVSIRGADLQRKYGAGQIAFVPFREAGLAVRCCAMSLLAVPLGMFIATAYTTAHRPVRSKESTLVLGALLLLLVESLQLLILSSYATSTDLFAGLVGIVFGLLASFQLHGGWTALSWRRQNDISRGYWTRIAPYAAAAVIYATLLTVSFCTPWKPITDNQLLSTRFSQLFRAPWAIVAQQSLSDCVVGWMIHAAWFAPLGALWALAIAGPAIPAPVRKLLLLLSVCFFAGVALAIEIVQVQLPGKIPSLTEVGAAVVGGTMGMAAGYLWLRVHSRSQRADLVDALERRPV